MLQGFPDLFCNIVLWLICFDLHYPVFVEFYDLHHDQHHLSVSDMPLNAWAGWNMSMQDGKLWKQRHESYWLRLRMECAEAGLQSLCIVVFTSDQGLPGDIILARGLWWRELLMV